MLAVSTFLGMILKWTNFHFEEIQVTFYADNKSLIDRQQQHLNYQVPYPNMTLGPEYDLLEEIFSIHSTYKIKAQFQHVKGHQDERKKFENLSIPAQLNVKADNLASRFYREGQLSSPIIHMTPSHKAHLILHGKSITNDYNNQLLRAHTEPSYFKHLQQKFQWDLPTLLSIDWTALKTSLRRIHRPSLTTKIVNNILPTAKVLHRWKQQPTNACHLCGATEDFIHLI